MRCRPLRQTWPGQRMLLGLSLLDAQWGPGGHLVRTSTCAMSVRCWWCWVKVRSKDGRSPSVGDQISRTGRLGCRSEPGPCPGSDGRMGQRAASGEAGTRLDVADFLWVGEERCRRSCVKRGRRSSNSCLSVQVCRVRTDERWVLEEHRKDVS